MIQERYVADFIKKYEVGVVVRNFFHLDQLVKQLIESGQLEILQANAKNQKNEAYGEVSSFIGKILTTSYDQ